MSIFDEVIDRKNTNSLKHDFAKERKKPEDILPLWVADMDFQAPKEVLSAMEKVVTHGVFGYSDSKADYQQTVLQWFSKRFGWQAEAEWIVKSPGVVFAICMAIRALTKEGDSILIQQPVYYPFAASVIQNGRKMVNNELLYRDGHYEIDFEDLEQKIKEEKVKMFILCSPHNPVGRVWTKAELEKIAQICLKYKVFVVSDEIHCDFTYPNHQHTIFASLGKEIKDQCMVCTSPSKSFNLAGLQTSNIFIPKKEYRDAFLYEMYKTGYMEINIFGLTACQEAYEKGGPWLDELKEYIQGNLDFIRDFLKEHLPEIKLVEPEGTYLAWLDCSGLGLSDEALEELIVNKAKLWLDAGTMFGSRSGQFERINMTSPRSVIQKAFQQLEEALQA